ncbi:MAG: hypothetical protein AAGC85_18670 [Bacteroidota bacterium]
MNSQSSHIKAEILKDLEGVTSPSLLEQIRDFLKLMKIKENNPKGNIEQVLAFAGTIDDKEAAELKDIINQAFNHIEGEW